MRIWVSTVFYAHFPKAWNCEICQRTQITRAPCRRRNGGVVPRAENFGGLITADHKVLSENCESRNNHRYAVVVQDLATQWIQAFPCKKNVSGNRKELAKVLGARDSSLEFGKACEDLSWNHCTSTPHRSETNGIAERALRRVKEGTSAVLLQSGLNESWWADSMECDTHLWNVTDLLSDGKTPCERRVLGNHLKDHRLFHLVHWLSITLKLRRTSQESINLERKSYLDCTRTGIWKGDIIGCRPWGVGNDGHIWNLLEKTQCKRGDNSQRKWNIYFPVADGRIKLSGGDQDLRTSTLIREGPIRGESHVDFLGESEGSLPPPHDSFPDAGEAMHYFWSMSGNFIYRHHVEPRVKTLLVERRITPCSTEIHWRLQNYPYKLGCSGRTPQRWLWEYRWVKRFVSLFGQVSLSLLHCRRNVQTEKCGPGGVNEKTADIQARPFMARTLGEDGKECQAEGEAKVVTWKASPR